MRRTGMRNGILAGAATAALLLAGCSGDESSYESSESMESIDAVSEEAADEGSMGGAPDIDVTAAPGVAFDYRYAFRLADAKIAGVQEKHAEACEKLGVTQCRITGMRYRLVDEERVEARLELKLDPAIARSFGRDAIATAQKAEGVLVDSEISGEDAGSRIDDAQRRSASARSQIQQIEQRLAQPGLGDAERTELQMQLQELRQRIEGERNSRATDQEKLASTPMTLVYNGGETIPGFGNGNPFEKAWETGVASFVFATSALVMMVTVLLPWLLVLGLLWLLWRSPLFGWLRRYFAKSRELERAPSPPSSRPED